MEPAKLVALYLEAYFVLTGIRVNRLEDIPEKTYLFFQDMQADYLAHPVILHYRRKNWSHRRISEYVGISTAKIKVLLKLHEL